MSFKKILVPTDFSMCADIAIGEALDLARTFDAHVTLLHVYQLPVPISEGALMVLTESIRAIEERARASLAAVKTEALRRWRGSQDTIDARLAIGTPSLRIVEEASKGDYDLIVMGTHGRTGLRHALVGSVTERVVRSASCPVLTIRGRLGAVVAGAIPQPPVSQG